MVDGRRQKLHIKARFEVSHPQALVHAGTAGLGIAQIPNILVQDRLRRGRLRRILTDCLIEGPDICAIWPQNRYMSLRVRVFIDWLIRVAGRGAVHRYKS